jgi:hypothetical protein
LIAAAFPAVARRLRTRAASALVIAGVLVGLGGSTAYAAATLPQAHLGGGPSVGPARPEPPSPANDIRREVMAFVSGATEPQVAALLRDTTTVDRSSTAAALELASRTPVIAIGGFTSDDPVPTLDDFENLVRTHQVTYYLAQEVKLPDSWRVKDQPGITPDPAQPANPDSGWWRPAGHKDIADWVAAHYTSVHIGNVAVYDLTVAPH